MAKHTKFVSTAAMAVLLLSFATQSGHAASASVDDTARALAGLPPSAGSPLGALVSDPIWKQHAKAFDEAWDSLDKRQISKVRAWRSKNFTTQKSTLYYMFSGPDFMYADAFFPSVDTIIMAGLEPPGLLPNFVKMSKPEIGAAMSELRSSLGTVMNYSFFITNHMRVDLNSGRIVGTLPVLVVFMERAGKTIYDISFVDLTSDGTVRPVEYKVEKPTAKGVKISYSDNTGRMKTLYYFSTDISDKGLASSGFLTFMDKFGTGDAFVKSASYLMHNESFSKIREFLMAHSDVLLQDDSGIPVRYLSKGWRLEPYGAYVGPIPVFRGQTQAVLYQLFAKGRAKPLEFGIGYQYRNLASNLLMAIKDPNADATDMLTKPVKTAGQQKADGGQAVEESKQPRPRRRSTNSEAFNPFPKLFGYSQ